MLKKIKLLLIIFICLGYSSIIFSSENFFEEGQKKYNEKKFDDSKFLFQRNIVFNPKDANSYLYLAKIYKIEENEKEEEKNINTVLLLDPKNEEAIYILMEIELKKSNYSKIKELSQNFLKVCKNLCEKNKSILESLKNLEPKNES
jgi:tetratricopeptide (TPR) repeat protein